MRSSLNIELRMPPPPLLLAQTTATLTLRRLRARLLDPTGAFLDERRRAVFDHLALAVRRAGLAVEVAFAGTELWDRLDGDDAFRQQAEGLRATFADAGADPDD